MVEETNAAEGVEKQPKSTSTLKLIIAGVVIIILAAGISFGVAMLAFKTLDKGEPAKGDGFGKVKSATLGTTFDAGEYITNLANEGGSRFIKVKVVLAFPDPKMSEEIQNKTPEIQHTINIVLRGHKAEDLAKPKAMENLADSLKKEINGLLLNGNISSVYFTSFVVQ
ncbi:MAG: flagellar basal body-associated FliL family protein [Thermincola sp.]|jgi:flagellar FliL protein|nr:flagellar basal body-associated FliL family protein [Thermincola sp.]MDT3701785.1 flagellar basal body-associated FliL family protein [Thermincola sp.]